MDHRVDIVVFHSCFMCSALPLGEDGAVYVEAVRDVSRAPCPRRPLPRGCREAYARAHPSIATTALEVSIAWLPSSWAGPGRRAGCGRCADGHPPFFRSSSSSQALIFLVRRADRRESYLVDDSASSGDDRGSLLRIFRQQACALVTRRIASTAFSRSFPVISPCAPAYSRQSHGRSVSSGDLHYMHGLEFPQHLEVLLFSVASGLSDQEVA